MALKHIAEPIHIIPPGEKDKMSNYGCGKFMLDCLLVVMTGGLWFIWIFVREMRKNK